MTAKKPKKKPADVPAVIRFLASDTPRRRGHPPEIDPGSVALDFALLRARGLGVNAAHDKLAERHGVSVTAIKKALKKYRPAAEDIVDAYGVYVLGRKRRKAE
jgi:hypothetical protein